MLLKIEIDGFRMFRHFVAELGPLTVIVGASGVGKSSLFDFLRFDPRDGRATHEHVCYALTFDLGQGTWRYDVELVGPVVARERLRAIEDNILFFDFVKGEGVVRSGKRYFARRVKSGMFALNEVNARGATDARAFLASCRFYNIRTDARMRVSIPAHPEPILQEHGGNLSAVLMWLSAEHPDAWEELASTLRSAVPGLRSLHVKPYGAPGTVIVRWREDGVDAELTLADLSDGTLRLLCWAALCLSPKLLPLLCIDEPERGLHPTALPVLAGLLKFASSRAQILVATHSPYFLSQFSLDDIAVMRKEDGAARFVRPATSTALRDLVEEIGGEAIARLHISDELETLPE